MRMALLGPPGSGKGTQAARICAHFGLAHLSSGDILRAEKNAGTAQGHKIRSFIDSGLLVPDDLMLEVMNGRVTTLNTGFVLDGFPRTLVQARALNKLLFDIDRPLNLALNFVVNPKALARRFAGRRICPVCLSVYHVDSMPPARPGLCDNDDAELITRDDDRPEVVEKRIATYQETMAPLIAFYAQLGILKTIDATGSIEEVTATVLDKIRRHFDD